ncbi:MAG: DUF1801 domain-containing protein [Stackebrandtia sp.]
MTKQGDPATVEAAWSEVLETCDPEVRGLAQGARRLLRETIPDAVEEVDASARLLGFTFQPGTYKGLVAAVTVHKKHANIMFGKGVELAEHDDAGLLEGTGKRARHVKVVSADRLEDPRVKDLISRAASLTPRG